MSFLSFYTQPTQKEIRFKKSIYQIFRKEADSTRTQSVSSYFIVNEERASLFASSSGSVSIEAALVTPMFFLALCCLCYLLEIMAIQNYVHASMHDVGKQFAEEVYMKPIVFSSDVEGRLVENIGANRLNRSIVKGGSAGLDCSKSHILPGSGLISIHVKYDVVLPIVMFGRLSITCEDSLRLKGWNGYTRGGIFEEREDIVYVSETGMVYHKDYHCTYLELSIQMADRKQIENMRNEQGAKYYPCERCGGAGEKVYITSQGNRYHGSLGCSGLKRSVYAVPLSEVIGKGACSRCG